MSEDQANTRMLTLKYFVQHPSKGAWTNFDTVIEQMGRARRFRNFLVEKRLQRLAVEEEEKCASPLIPTYAGTKAQIAAVYKGKGEILAAIKKKRSTAAYAAKMSGVKKEADEDYTQLQERVKALDAKRKALDVDRKAMSKAFWDHQKTSMSEKIIAARKHEHDTTLVAASGLHAPTYVNLQRAFEASITDGYGAPRFKKIDQVTLAEQGPMKNKKRLVGGWTHKQFHTDNGGTWIEPVPESAFSVTASSSDRGQGKRSLRRTFLNMRVGRRSKSKSKEQPLPDSAPDALFARIPILMHRPIPQEGIIKNVYLHCRGFGQAAQWSVTIQVELPPAQSITNTASGTIGIDIGWAKLPNGDIRVATAADNEGNLVSELVLPASWAALREDNSTPLPKVGEGCSIMAKVEHIKSIRSTLFDEVNHHFVALEKTRFQQQLEEKGLNFWAERVHRSKPSQWGSTERALNFVRECHEVFPKEISDSLRGVGQRHPSAPAWYHRETHLAQMESGLRKKFYNKRNYLYQQWVLGLAQSYGEVHIEKNVLKAFSTAPAEENGPASQGSAVRRQKNLAAVSKLVTIVKQTFGRVGGVVHEVEARYTSQTCSACGHIDRKSREDRTFACVKCGCQLDADHNGAINIARSTKFLVKEVKKRKMARRKTREENASTTEVHLAA